MEHRKYIKNHEYQISILQHVLWNMQAEYLFKLNKKEETYLNF